MRRHDLLGIGEEAWQAMLGCHPALHGVPGLARWSQYGWPVIVRRRMAGEAACCVPAAVPLPPCWGKRRVGFSLASTQGVRRLKPVLLQEAADIAPDAWQPGIAALLRLGAEIGVAPRVFGAMLWQHTTGMAYLTAQSDLDLLWKVGDRPTAARLLDGLRAIDAGSAMRIDGELELPDGGGVNWREFHPTSGLHNDGTRATTLVKTIDSVSLRRCADLFAVSASIA